MERLYTGPDIRVGNFLQKEEIFADVSCDDLNQMRIDAVKYVLRRPLTPEEVDSILETKARADAEEGELRNPNLPYEVLSGQGYLREVIGEPTSNKPGRIVLMEYSRSEGMIPKVTITTRETRGSR